jgi:hypothetical protein
MPEQHDIYHVRVLGHLDEQSVDGLEGWAMTSRASGETLLSGPVADQAALHAVLARLRDLNLPLLLVARSNCPCPKRCPRHGLCPECAANHGAKGKLPYCFREKGRWERQCAALLDASRAG